MDSGFFAQQQSSGKSRNLIPNHNNQTSCSLSGLATGLNYDFYASYLLKCNQSGKYATNMESNHNRVTYYYNKYVVYNLQ